MKICPAILTNNIDSFREKLRFFQVFETIDIDIVIPGMLTPASKTLGTTDVLNEINRYPHKKYRIHLMCDFPLEEINRVVEKIKFLDVTFIIHQESSFNYEEIKSMPILFGIAIKLDSQFKPIDYYKHFPLVQLMSVEIGGQGNKFNPKSLERVKELRELGYDREVSLDGGINLETINQITKFQVDDISVGSYFSKSLDVVEDKRKLEKAIELNLSRK